MKLDCGGVRLRSIRLSRLGSGALAIPYAPEVDAGEPTPLIGLYERVAFSGYFLWLSVLAVALWRKRSVPHGGLIRMSGDS
jgi:hypothetical protein